ncbi:NADPH:quinone oxidoreductase family protein [Notoacmeibacter sp. MSK16QG-6]|uniref:NADPH:quinone oxidoreductase family protein n=1 Tax=Notoacmeibacter sp. MSK16QG-6 TaxID=2957982 RepID=UPI0020A081D5|nr:NADPH:quinone oxidoreductase family protein [Notoacmeibacter sp. MSK16QG-6]MCP1200344.1 NADPH:quinone oxidoreductase family protein [Notoacmeibacter sp. MSK16QG-6]
MRAVLAEKFGPVDTLSLTDIDDPSHGKGDVLVSVGAAGINFPDGLMVQGLYQVKPGLPFVPGMEAAGTVLTAGERVKHLKEGDRVLALCGTGAFAQKVAVSAARCVTLPDGVSFSDACALGVGYSTAHHALKQRGNLKDGETLVVLGAAGLTGLAAIQIGKIMGARVIAVASSDEKRALAKENGADEAIGYDNLRDDLKSLTGGNGIDVAFDPVGGDAFDALSRAMAWNGRLLVIGFASGRIPELPINLTLVKGYSLVGVFWGTFTAREPEIYADNMRELFGWYAAGKVRPVVSIRNGLSSTPDALNDVLDRRATGKIVIVPEETR